MSTRCNPRFAPLAAKQGATWQRAGWKPGKSHPRACGIDHPPLPDKRHLLQKRRRKIQIKKLYLFIYLLSLFFSVSLNPSSSYPPHRLFLLVSPTIAKIGYGDGGRASKCARWVVKCGWSKRQEGSEARRWSRIVEKMSLDSVSSSSYGNIEEQISQLMQCKPLSEQEVPSLSSLYRVQIFRLSCLSKALSHPLICID